MRGITLISALLLGGMSWGADTITPLDIKLGLWETKATTEMGGMPRMQQAPPAIPPEALARMTPEQRANFEAMIKARATGGPMVTTTKVCMTRESLSNPLAFTQRGDRACTPKVVSSSATRQQIHMECEGMQASGDLTIDRVDSSHIKGTIAMKGSPESPRPVNLKMSFDTTWISSDCGAVKPPSPSR